MRVVPESDTGVAMVTGAFTLGLFVLGVLVVTYATPMDVGRRELVGFGVGFALFMGIYFLSMSADRVLTGDDQHE